MEEEKTRNTIATPDGISSETIPSFLLKTYEILENDKYSDIICWTKNGEGFIVKKVKEFSQNVLPIYFRHSNYTSFVRQLNMYDFHKTRQENHENAFKNLMFKRGYKHTLKDIQRKDYKKNKDSPKDVAPSDRNLQKSYSYSKNDKVVDLARDQNKEQIRKINQISSKLENKAVILANLRQIPQSQTGMTRLLDVLFDSKKMLKDIIERLQKIKTIQQPERKVAVQLKFDQSIDKLDCFVEGKDGLTACKQDHQFATNVSLFSSFNQI